MNRAIKFRCWNGGKMQYDFNPYPYTFNNFGNPIMQFTGFVDKDDKEIYEEDIVKSWLQGEEDKAVIDVVRDIRDCYILDSGHAFDNSSLEFEVIGNTFENPELLND